MPPPQAHRPHAGTMPRLALKAPRRSDSVPYHGFRNWNAAWLRTGIHPTIGEDRCYKGASRPYRYRKSRTTHRDYATFCLRIVVRPRTRYSLPTPSIPFPINLGETMRALLLALTLLTLATAQANAGEQTGTVRIDHGQFGSSATSAGLMFFVLQGGTKTGKPSCNTYIDRWVINNAWPAAKIQTAVLLAAITSGKTVTVRGSNDCTQWLDSETAIDIQLNN